MKPELWRYNFTDAQRALDIHNEMYRLLWPPWYERWYRRVRDGRYWVTSWRHEIDSYLRKSR